MKISKEYRWEMGHRLPNHNGLCRNIHGHSYKMIVELNGSLNKNGMIIDFYDLNKIIKPIINKYDHCFLCWEGDRKLLNFLIINKMKYISVNYQSTVENICIDLINKISSKIKKLKIRNINTITVKIFESPNSFAEKSLNL